MTINITEEESLLLQCLSTTALLGDLLNENFLESDYFKKLTCGNAFCKMVLEQSGLGNPAMMQMMLYALLTVPKEVLSRGSYSNLERYAERINPFVCALVEPGTYSTYENEESTEKINYFRHIRNAVAHSKCKYVKENQINYVIFIDNMHSKECSIKIECGKMGSVLTELQRLIIKCVNDNL